jgi:Fic family protein
MVQFIPPQQDVETKQVLKKVAQAHRALAELKGVAASIPNQSILLNTLVLQEAKESSAVENIITTFDELYRYRFATLDHTSAHTKEVHSYAEALRQGFQMLKKQNLLTNREILQIQELVEKNNAGFRKQAGTKLINDLKGEVVYEPPQTYDEILKLMGNLVNYINDDQMHDVDPLIKMAIVHHQFETIHPFYDGNGRTGRILNILYLVKCGLLNLPILYMSRYIIRHKSDYYRLLQSVRDTGDYEPWVLYILDAVEQSAIDAIRKVTAIKTLMQRYKVEIRTKLPKVYSQDLLNNLFNHPYTKIDYIAKDLAISRLTATKYLNSLTALGLLRKQKFGRDNYYIHDELFRLLSEGG